MNIIEIVEDKLKNYPIYSQSEEKDPLVLAKLFLLASGASWYITEYDPVNKIIFCYVE